MREEGDDDLKEVQSLERFDPEGEGFGWVIEWSACHYSAKFKAYEVVGAIDGGAKLYFLIDGWSTSDERTEDRSKAEIQYEVRIRWDGCADIELGEKHWCGSEHFKRHIILMEHLYREASVRMRRERREEDPW